MERLGWGPMTPLIGAALLVSGCAGQAIPQRAVTQTQARQASTGYFTYVSGGCDGVCVLAYPSGDLIASIRLKGTKEGACSDGAGNVFITNDTQVVEYAHGGTAPIATLALPGGAATGCAVDSTTGDLAVVFNASGIGVGIFPHASGPPTIYGAGLLPVYVGYDGSGNLFASGYGNGNAPGISELAKGSSSFSVLSVKGTLGDPGQIQWDGHYMTYESRTKGSIRILRLKISGSTATIVKTKQLKSIRAQAYQSWIYKDAILVPYGNGGAYANNVGLWRYPRGSKVQIRYRQLGAALYGVTVSVAPSHSRTRH